MAQRDFIAEYHEAVTPEDRLLAIFRYHMARMWPQRHDGKPGSRKSIRDNIAGQRACHRQAERSTA